MTSPRCRKGVHRYGFDKKRTHAACNVVYLDRHRVIVVPAPSTMDVQDSYAFDTSRWKSLDTGLT